MPCSSDKSADVVATKTHDILRESRVFVVYDETHGRWAKLLGFQREIPGIVYVNNKSLYMCHSTKKFGIWVVWTSHADEPIKVSNGLRLWLKVSRVEIRDLV
nr:hypothetical protein [Tanacetum cinerariifolium]